MMPLWSNQMSNIELIFQIPGTKIIIEKGTPIYISLYGLQQDEKYFDQPEMFNPERHNQKLSDAYIPFGVGPRMCVGKL